MKNTQAVTTVLAILLSIFCSELTYAQLPSTSNGLSTDQENVQQIGQQLYKNRILEGQRTTASLKPFLTTKLFDLLSKIDNAKEDEIVLEVDPFENAQDDRNGFTVESPMVTGNEGSLTVNLSSFEAQGAPDKVFLQFEKASNGEWRVADVCYPKQESLLSLLSRSSKASPNPVPSIENISFNENRKTPIGPTIKGFFLGMNIEEAINLIKSTFPGQEIQTQKAGGETFVGISNVINISSGSDNEVKSLIFLPVVFNAADMVPADFARSIMDAYKVPKLQASQSGPYAGWFYQSPEGWRIVIEVTNSVSLRRVIKATERKFD